jgi:hypothetical protein
VDQISQHNSVEVAVFPQADPRTQFGAVYQRSRHGALHLQAVQAKYQPDEQSVLGAEDESTFEPNAPP